MRYVRQSYAHDLRRGLAQDFLLSFGGFLIRRCFLTFRKIDEIEAA